MFLNRNTANKISFDILIDMLLFCWKNNNKYTQVSNKLKVDHFCHNKTDNLLNYKLTTILYHRFFAKVAEENFCLPLILEINF